MAPVSDMTRDLAISRLRNRYSRGEVSLDEFSERLDAIFEAPSDAEIAEAVGESALDIREAAATRAPDRHEPGAYEVISRQLGRGEHVAWIGKPDPRKRFSPADKWVIPFMVLWLLLVVGLVLAGIHARRGDPAGAWFNAVWWFIFLMYFLFGRFVLKARRKRRTLYAITNRRVITVVRRRSGDQVNSGYLKGLPAVNERLRSDGSGSVIFGNPSFRESMYGNSGMDYFGWGSTGPPAFYDIKDAKRVAELVRELHDE